MIFLPCAGRIGQIAGQEQRLSHHPAHLCLSPNLIDFVIGQIPCAVNQFALPHVHGPETAVARGILQKIADVAGAEKDTAAGQFFYITAIGGAIAVITQAQKLLYAGDICSAESVKFGHLDQPNTLQKLGCLFALKGADTVVVPALAHPVQQRGFAEALRAAQNQHIVEFASRLHRAGHSTDKRLAGDSAGIGGIIRSEVVDEQGVQPGHSIPRQPLEEILHLVKCVCSRMDVQPRVNGIALSDLVSLFHVPIHGRNVRISPRPPLKFVGVFVPRQGIQNLTASAE